MCLVCFVGFFRYCAFSLLGLVGCLFEMLHHGRNAGAALSIPLKHTRTQILLVRMGLKQQSSTRQNSFQKLTDGKTIQWLLERERESMSRPLMCSSMFVVVYEVFLTAEPRKLLHLCKVSACVLTDTRNPASLYHTIFLSVIHTNRRVLACNDSHDSIHDIGFAIQFIHGSFEKILNKEKFITKKDLVFLCVFMALELCYFRLG